MTGAELARQIAVLYPNLPVIVATGYAELSGGAEPGTTRLAKPFTQEQLSEALTSTAPS
jgi:CheY-like chemotaxis protein